MNTSKPATEKQKEVIKQQTKAFAKLAAKVEQLPVSRERSLAITNLEQALMWANKAIVFGPQALQRHALQLERIMLGMDGKCPVHDKR